jgi:hypothetical protein
MTVSYEYDSALNIIHARPSDTLSIREIGSYFNDIMNERKIRQGIIEVVHFKNVDEFLFSSSEALIIPKMYGEFKERMKLKRTILIGESDIHFGIARMLQIIFEMKDIQRVVFAVRSETEANTLIQEIIDKPAYNSKYPFNKMQNG